MSSVDWSVRLLMTEDEAQAFSVVARWPIHGALRSMSIGGGRFDNEIEDTPYVTFELEAEHADAAERLALQLASGVLAEAGIERRSFPVVWVAPLDGAAVGGHRFLAQAKELHDSEQYDLAVVAAQIHFEVQMRLLLERAARRIDRPWAKRLLRNQRIASLSNDVSVGTVELLLQTDVRRTRKWPEFSAHVRRRNAVVHEGRAVGSRDSRASIKAVEGLWATLAEAERSSRLF